MFTNSCTCGRSTFTLIRMYENIFWCEGCHNYTEEQNGVHKKIFPNEPRNENFTPQPIVLYRPPKPIQPIKPIETLTDADSIKQFIKQLERTKKPWCI